MTATKKLIQIEIEIYIETEIDDIKILNMKIVDNKFHPRFSAKSKIYKYKIHILYDVNAILYQDFQLNYFREIDYKLMQQCIDKLIGIHDFLSFTAKEDYQTSERNIFNI